MAKKKQARAKPAVEQAPGGGFGGLGALLVEAGLAPEPRAELSEEPLPAPEPLRPSRPERPSEPADPTPPDPRRPSPAATGPLEKVGKLVVRREKAGRGGKTVTAIGGLPDDRLPELAKSLRKALGTGASVDGSRVLVQGALVERVSLWLEAQGAKRVVRGN